MIDKKLVGARPAAEAGGLEQLGLLPLTEQPRDERNYKEMVS